jgi:hypothetical protein
VTTRSRILPDGEFGDDSSGCELGKIGLQTRCRRIPMLSEHERRVLNELEADLSAVATGWRSRVRQVVRACRLPVLLLALAAIVAVTAAALLPGTAALAVAIPLAVGTGWTGSGVVRRCGLLLSLQLAVRRRRKRT